MSYSTDPATDWDRWISKQESTHDTLHPIDRTLDALRDADGFYEAEVGEYGVEAELLTDLLRAAVQREGAGRGSDWDIARRAKALAQEVMRNRGARYWELADETKMRAIAARSAA